MFSVKDKNLANKEGMTLVEAVITVTLFSLIMVAVMASVTSLYRINAYTIAQSYQVDNARRGMDLLIRDIREMTFADDGTFPLAIMDDNLIGFYSDIDRDESVEYIEYELVGTTTLEKRVYNATGNPPVYDTTTADEIFTLSEYVQNDLQVVPTFLYYDNSGNLATATSTITDIRYIEAQIVVNIDPIREPGEYMLRSSAALRNLKENL